MKNIEIFKELSALVMADLYQSFPLPRDIVISELSLRLSDEHWDEALKPNLDNPGATEYQPQFSPVALATPTIKWLASAGLLSYEQQTGSKFLSATLTPKGLEAIEAEASNAQRLVNGAKAIALEATKDEAKEQLRAAFGEVLRWCVEKSPTIIQWATSSAA